MSAISSVHGRANEPAPPATGPQYEVGGLVRNAGSAVFHGVKGGGQTTAALFGGAGAGIIGSVAMRLVKEPEIGARAAQFSVRTAARSIPASIGAVVGAMSSQALEANGLIPHYKSGEGSDAWDQRGVEFLRAGAAGVAATAISLPIYLARPDIFRPSPDATGIGRLTRAMDMHVGAGLPKGKFLAEWAAKAGAFFVLPAIASAWINHDEFDAKDGKLVPPGGSLF